MRGTRQSEEQVIAILKQGDSGVKTAELCRQYGITEGTYYRWKAKYGGMDVSDAKKLKQLEERKPEAQARGGGPDPRQTPARNGVALPPPALTGVSC
jgi:transposase-like protein